MYGNTPYQAYPYANNFGGMPNYQQRPYNPQPQQSAQPQPQVQPTYNMPPQMPMELPIQDIKFVNKAQAEAYIVYPNSKVMLIDKESGIAYIKTADGMGQSKTDYFRFEPINADGSPIKPQEPTPQIDFSDYIKKEDLEKFGFVTIAQYNELAQKLDYIQKRLEGAKQNGGQPKTN